MKSSVAALVLGAALPLGLAYAASESAESKQDAEKKAFDRGVATKAETAKPRDDLESCKRDAGKLRGPERARFMTDCLKKRD